MFRKGLYVAFLVFLRKRFGFSSEWWGFLDMYGQSALLLVCDPSYYPYVIDVTYKEDASSQSIEVFQIRNDSSPFVTSIYGYGKDYLMESTLLCVNNNLYRFTCASLYPLLP